MHELGFVDAFHEVKEQENSTALMAMPILLKKLDDLSGSELIQALIDNILGGNMYDWYTFDDSRGTTPLQELIKSGKFDFSTAKAKVGHCHLNHSVALVARLQGTPYKKAILFVDNSGSDFILGILPFTRFLLSKGTHVILAANSYPALNDITVQVS